MGKLRNAKAQRKSKKEAEVIPDEVCITPPRIPIVYFIDLVCG